MEEIKKLERLLFEFQRCGTCMDCRATAMHLVRRAIAAEKLVEALKEIECLEKSEGDSLEWVEGRAFYAVAVWDDFIKKEYTS